MMIANDLWQAAASSALGLIAVGSLSLLSVWSSLRTLKQGIRHLKRLHQIPCHRCQYFTGDYRLKCTVQPTVACTDDAISCCDFTPSSQPAPKQVSQPAQKKEMPQGKERSLIW
jgi:hypothetical protein